MTNGTGNRLTGIEHTHRKISDGHRRRNRATERHHKTTSAIGKKTRMDGVDDAKRLKGRLDDKIGYFERQVTNINGANGLVSGGDWYRDVAEEERGALEEIVPVFTGLAGNTDFTIPQELDSRYFINV